MAAEKDPSVDMKRALSLFDNDIGFYREMFKKFLEYAPEKIEKLREAARSGDLLGVEVHAHGIKGAAGNLGALKVFSTAGSIEEKGRRQDIQGVLSLIEDLSMEISSLKDFPDSLHG